MTERADREESEKEVSCSFCGDFAMALSLAPAGAAGAAAAAVVKAAVGEKFTITRARRKMSFVPAATRVLYLGLTQH